jgi:hypothetical protein
MTQWITNLSGHPSEPEAFTFTQTRSRPEATVVTRTYVAFDSRWPWWKKRLARLANQVHRVLNSKDVHP